MIRLRLKYTQKGFTLVELMFALSMFSLMMIIATVGFVAMNRSYTRGLARKQLSEGAQRTVAAIDRSITGKGLTPFTICDGGGGDSCPSMTGTGWQGALCFEGQRYIWGERGLFLQSEKCDTSLPSEDDGVEAEQLLSDRFKVDALGVSTIGGGSNLYRVQAVLRTSDDSDFDFDDSNPARTVCKPTSGATQVCAIEVVDTIINARGDGSTGESG